MSTMIKVICLNVGFIHEIQTIYLMAFLLWGLKYECGLCSQQSAVCRYSQTAAVVQPATHTCQPAWL